MSKSKKPRFRRHLSVPGLVRGVRLYFQQIEDPVGSRKASLADHMMAALAMFFFKSPSMLDFDRKVRGREPNPKLVNNLKTLFKLRHVPCDSAMRKRLDPVDPEVLRPTFKMLFSRLQRGHGLKGLSVLDGHYLVAIDGTEYYKSEKVHCARCCIRNKRGGKTEYFHQMLCASLVSPDSRAAFPLTLPEMIGRSDGSRKNDCELNAFKRLMPTIRREHPHLKIAVLLDALYGKAPQVRQLRELGMNFLIGVKNKDHAVLFGQLETDGESHEITDDDGVVHRFRWRNGAELNDSNRDVLVNVMSYSQETPAREVRKSGGRTRTEPAKVTRFAWITDFEIDRDQLMPLMRAGRARWRIENNLFNVMKNQNYNMARNYGHGDQNLSAVLVCLMMLAFLIDQIQERCCSVFQAALRRCQARTALWRLMEAVVTLIELSGWEDFMAHLIGNPKSAPPTASA